MVRATWIALLAVASMAKSTSAAAEGSAVDRAEAHKAEAFRLFASGDYQAGINQMEEAYKLVQHPGFLLNIAVAYDRWGGRCTKALDAFDRFFGECGQGCSLNAAGQDRAEDVRARCLSSVSLDSEPSGARVLLNGKNVGRTPLSLKVRPGSHLFEAQLDGHRAAKQMLEIGSAETKRVDFKLDHDAPSLPVLTRPDEPPPPTPVHNDVVAAASLHRPMDLEPLSWSSFLVGAGGAVAGTVFTLSTVSKLEEEEEARRAGRPRAEIQALQSSAQERAIIANVGFAVAIVGAATGVVLLLLDEDPEEAFASGAAGRGFAVAF